MRIFIRSDKDEDNLESAIRKANQGDIIFIACDEKDSARYSFANFWESYRQSGNWETLTQRERLESKRGAICAWYAATGQSAVDLPYREDDL